MTKVGREVSQLKGRVLKGKVGGGSEVRTQRFVHDEGDDSATGRRGWGGGGGWGCGIQVVQDGAVGFITARVQPRVQSTRKASDKTPSHIQNTKYSNSKVNSQCGIQKRGGGGIKE